MVSSTTKNTKEEEEKKKKKRRSKRRKLRKLFLPDLEIQMRGGHEQQSQIAWETVVNDVKKLDVIWLDLGMLYLSFFLSINISKTQPIYFFTSLYVEVSRYQTLSIFSDVISDQMSLVAVRMTSFSFFVLPSTF